MAQRDDRTRIGSMPGPWMRLALLAVLLASLTAFDAKAQATVTQEFTLRPGWNAIHLEVQPQGECSVTATACYDDDGCPGGEVCDTSIATVFAGVPIASIWTFDGRFGGRVSDLIDPAVGLVDVTGWFGYFPPTRDEAVLTNLHKLRVNRAYLVKLDGVASMDTEVTGRPSLRRQRWEPDSFNLVGFHVSPTHPPSFGSWFEPSPAHAGQAIYRLDPAGVWQPVLPYFEPITAGEAYWVWTEGVSDYQGPMEVELDFSDHVDFGAGLERGRVLLHSNHDLNTTATVRVLDSANPVPLKYDRIVDETTGQHGWEFLPAEHEISAPEGKTVGLSFAVDRGTLASGSHAEQVLEIEDGLGSRRLVVFSADAAQEVETTSELAGLWVGAAFVNRVQEVRCEPSSDYLCVEGTSIGTACQPEADNPCPGASDSEDACRLHGMCQGGDTPGALCDAELGGAACSGGGTCDYCTPVPVVASETSRGFGLRLIVHIDAAGNARLLKDVIQLFQPGTSAPDPDFPEYYTIVEPGEYVLITDDGKIPSHDGVAMRDGVPVGVRVSTVAYDFDGNDLTMARAGDLRASGQLSATLTIPSTSPTNPYRHRYHPDQNCTSQPCPQLVPVPQITRTITLSFRSDFSGQCSTSGDGCRTVLDCPANESCEGAFLDGRMVEPPDWGAERLGGGYHETIGGLHRNAIEVEGLFLLSRASTTAELNP